MPRSKNTFRLAGALAFALAAVAAGCGGYPGKVDGKTPQQWIDDLKGEDQQKREVAKKALELMGPKSVQALNDFFVAADPKGKVDAADLLTTIAKREPDAAGKAAPALLEALSHPDENVRRVVGTALANIGRPAVQGLCGIASGDDKVLRERALGILSEIGPKAGSCIEPVAAMLSSPDASLRALAVKTLGRVGQADSRAVEALVKAVNDPDPEVRNNAAFALGQVRISQSLAVESLVKSLEDQQWQVRSAAVGSLGRIGKSAAGHSGRIAALAKDQSGDVRAEAIISAVALGLPDKDSILLLVDALLSCSDAEKHALADKISSFAVLGTAKVDSTLIDVMKWIGSLFHKDQKKAGIARNVVVKLGAKTVPHLRVMISSNDKDVQRAAASVLGEIGPGAEGAVTDLKGLLGSSDPAVRTTAAEALGMIGPNARPAIPDLIEKAADPDPGVRSAAISALTLLGPKPEQAIPVLTKALSDPEPEVAGRAAMAIASLGTDAAQTADALVAVMAGPEGIRWPVVVALGEIGAVEAVMLPALLKALASAETTVRRDGAKALGILGDKAASTAGDVAALLSDPDPEVRANACWALGRVRADKSKARALKERMADENASVRLRAVEAILELSRPKDRSGIPIEALLTGQRSGMAELGVTPEDCVKAVFEVLEKAVAKLDKKSNLNTLIWSSELIQELGGKSGAVVGVLANALKSGRLSDTPQVIVTILKTMQQLGPAEKSAIPALVFLIEEEEDEEVFIEAARYVGSFGADGVDALDGLVEYGVMMRNFPRLQIAAANAIGNMGAAAAGAIPRLEKAQGLTKNEEARRTIETAMIRIKAGG